MRRDAAAAYAAPLLAASYPVAVVVGSNLGIVPLRGAVLARALAVAFTVAWLVLWALRRPWPDLRARAAWLTALLLLFGFYGYANTFLQEQFWFPNRANEPGFAIPYVIAAAALAAVVTRPWEARQRDSRVPAVVAALLVLGALVPGVTRLARAQSVDWQRPADAILGAAPSAGAAATSPPRDIYYIVLDGLGSEATLRRTYGADLSTFTRALESRGFAIAHDAKSNYAQTYLSLASTLNMGYLDGLAAEMGPMTRDRRPLEYLIQRNAMMRLASQSGYRVVGIGSDYMATERLDPADDCACNQYGLDDIEMGAIALTPFAALPLDEWTYGAHRRKVIDAFAELQRASALPGRKLVFAHIVVPHPPFVFAADGSPTRPSNEILFAFSDGNHFRDTTASYHAGYRNQVQFVSRQVTDFIDFLHRQAGPAPAIVIHGDHGPGASMHWERPDAASLRDRMEIFAAYRFPDPGPEVYPAMTPVNGARALAERYFGVDAPRLPDQSFFSRWSRPYEFVPYPAHE